MANWTTPKVDYWDLPRPVGGEDYKRIEGNTAYLKTQTDGLKNGSIKAGLAKTAENADKLGGYAPNDIKKLTQLGYAIRIAGRADSSLNIYEDTNYYFKWRSAFAVGKKVFFEVNMYKSEEHYSDEKVYAQLYDYTSSTPIVEVSVSSVNPRSIATSDEITIPDGHVVGVRINRGLRGQVFLRGAWLIIL